MCCVFCCSQCFRSIQHHLFHIGVEDAYLSVGDGDVFLAPDLSEHVKHHSTHVHSASNVGIYSSSGIHNTA